MCPHTSGARAWKRTSRGTNGLLNCELFLPFSIQDMSESWTRDEVEATVADYFHTLTMELAGAAIQQDRSSPKADPASQEPFRRRDRAQALQHQRDPDRTAAPTSPVISPCEITKRCYMRSLPTAAGGSRANSHGSEIICSPFPPPHCYALRQKTWGHAPEL